jgi:hypothetical protein
MVIEFIIKLTEDKVVSEEGFPCLKREDRCCVYLGALRDNHVRASRTAEHLVCLLGHCTIATEAYERIRLHFEECQHQDSAVNFAERSAR